MYKQNIEYLCVCGTEYKKGYLLNARTKNLLEIFSKRFMTMTETCTETVYALKYLQPQMYW